VLAFSITSIVNVAPGAKVMLLFLLIASVVVSTTVKSKPGKIIIILFLLLSAVFLVTQQAQIGVRIKSVEFNSSAYDQGLRQGQIISIVNGQAIETIYDYNNMLSSEFPSTTSKKLSITMNDGTEYFIYANSAPKIILEELSSTNINLGLDLQGGSRALVKAENKSLTQEELMDLIDLTSTRLNVYGLSDLVIKSVSDLEGNNYMLIEIAGATPDELESLIGQQGKFEAKMGNQTVFTGGEDITHVERAGQNVRLECLSETSCRFSFGISLTEEAAERHAEITSKLSISSENPQYLSEKLGLYVDGVLVDELFVSKDLKGRATTQISVSGGEEGSNYEEARENTKNSMNQLQTVLKTGSLPYKLEIVKLDSISPTLGKKFINTILLAGLAALISVAFIILLRYRKFKLPLALLLTSFSEILIILGIAAMLNKFWSLDLPAIAGIIAVIGTGVDQQIVVLDESRSGTELSIKQRLKRAAAIILGSYLTTIGAMFPLMWSGAGLLKGFAIATIVGISVGVFITRPAFADIVKKIQD